MQKTKSILDELDLGDQDLGSPEPLQFEDGSSLDMPTLDELQADNLEQKAHQKALPRHLKRKSLETEKTQWLTEILTSPHKSGSYKVSTKKHGGIKRTRLYHARTSLCARGDVPVEELNNWSLSIQLYENCWYVVARRMQVTKAVHIAAFD